MLRPLLFVILVMPVAAYGAGEGPVPAPAGPGGVAGVTGALLLVLLVIGALAWGMRRFGRVQLGVSGAIRVLAASSVGQRERVVLVQVGETQLLLGVAPGRVQTLHVLEEPLSDPAPGQGTGFAERLAAAMGRGPSQ